MSLLSLKAKIECEGCGVHFSIEIDPGIKLLNYIDLPDIVGDSLRGEGGMTLDPIGHCEHGATSVQGGKWFCPGCTRKCDAFTEEDRELTEAEVEEALS